jgi:AcrR family transcriptional regulator
MPRPSRNVDQLLLQAGHALLPLTGVRGLSVRQVAERAGVNLGMFHYHFKSKDVFVRTILQQKYNDMFANLELESHRAPLTIENLRAAVNVLARFGRDNRVLLVRLLGDAFAGEAVAVEFLRANLPRHLGVVMGLIVQGQKEGVLRKLPAPQAVAFLMGGVGAPILLGAAALNSGFAPAIFGAQLEKDVFSDAAIAERVDMALAGMAARKKTGVKK